MKINNSPDRPLSSVERLSGKEQVRENGGGDGLPGSWSAADRVQLSNLSSSLTATSVNSTAHSNKLSALAAMNASGSYEVDAATVSASIIRHSLQPGSPNYL